MMSFHSNNGRWWDGGHTGEGEYKVPDIIGALRGHRLWRIDDDGWLVGTHFKVRWNEGENTARCLQARIESQLFSGSVPYQPGPVGVSYDDDGQPFFLPGFSPVKCPGIARGDHGCGFFVRHEQHYYHMTYEPGVRGIVEGWGRVEMGTMGFRAEKARIVALLKPRLDWREWFQMRRLRAEMNELVASLPTAPSDEIEEIERKIRTKSDFYGRVSRAVRLWPKVVEKYPNTPVYGELSDMIRDFPCPDPRRLLEDL